MTVHVFTGPTLSPEQVRRARPEAVVHPPVAHGDLLSGTVVPGDVVVIVDGLYHQQPPVRHKEILALLEAGVHVVGCSSMGALRAAELHQCGMIGSGRVFQMYRDGVIDADDEVAVVHSLGSDLSTQNVPLVGVRWAAAAARRAGVLTAREEALLVDGCRRLHYTERSWSLLRRSLQRADDDAGTVDRVLAFLWAHPEHASVKARDAVETLQRLEELTASPPRLGGPPSWRNPHSFAWEVEHRGAGTAHGFVGDAAVLRHHQLHAPGFPRVWRSFVLAELSGDRCAPEAESDVADRWASSLRVTGPAQLPHLTGPERGTLELREAVLRSLVRAYDSPRALYDLRAHRPELVADPEARRRVREALRHNHETWWRGRERLVDRLPRARLLRHLSGLWDRPCTTEELTAAARDRGLRDLEAALDAARVHFLRDLAEQGRLATSRWKVS